MRVSSSRPIALGFANLDGSKGPGFRVYQCDLGEPQAGALFACGPCQQVFCGTNIRT